MASNEETYKFVVDMIKKHGVPSTRYKGDIEIEWGKLRDLCTAKIAGLQVVLKTLKNRKVVDFEAGAVMKDNTIVSLVGQEAAEFNPDHTKFQTFRDSFTGENSVTSSFR